MKSITPELAAHLAGEVTTLATCWRVTRTDTVTFGFTDHDRDLVIDSITYRAASGMLGSASASQGLTAQSVDISGIISDDSITEEDILAGRYDFAEVTLFLVNHADLTHGSLWITQGVMGEIRHSKHQFITELQGIRIKCLRSIGSLYSPTCRAQFGDSRCGMNLSLHQVTGSISSVTSRSLFQDSGRTEANGHFTFGSIEFLSGNNNGLFGEVKAFSNASILLALPMPYAVEVGDNYRLTAGCDKLFATCAARFENAVNFRGEPHVPGLDRLMETAGTRSEW
jgi:uncharacterized phage protein (TIGR02218 family)